jgi:hypothetical protein
MNKKEKIDATIDYYARNMSLIITVEEINIFLIIS